MNPNLPLEVLKHRLLEKIKLLGERVSDPKAREETPKLVSNWQTELNAANRRLRLMDNKILLGRTVE